MLVKNWNFDQKLKYLLKIEILIKNWNVRQQLKFWSKIEILVNQKIVPKATFSKNYKKSMLVKNTKYFLNIDLNKFKFPKFNFYFEMGTFFHGSIEPVNPSQTIPHFHAWEILRILERQKIALWSVCKILWRLFLFFWIVTYTDSEQKKGGQKFRNFRSKMGIFERSDFNQHWIKQQKCVKYNEVNLDFDLINWHLLEINDDKCFLDLTKKFGKRKCFLVKTHFFCKIQNIGQKKFRSKNRISLSKI